MKLFETSKYTEYYVTKKGYVFGLRFDKLYLKKPTVHSRGYVYVRTVTKNYQLHRLVACAFIDNPENKPQVNHKDGNKQNNDFTNLGWVTSKENNAHARRNGLTKPMRKNEGNLKYTNEQCIDVLRRVSSGMTYIEAGKKYSMPYSTVAHLKRGSRRKI